MNIIILDKVASTSTYLSEMQPTAAHGTVVAARCQSAGRGQRGNRWESAPGMNVTLSVMLRPEGLHVADSYLLSEAVSVAVANALDCFLGAGTIRLKWPNDVYVADRKLGGILIENSLRGAMVERSIVGVGVNVNQRVFLSPAPNPVSMAQASGRNFDVDEVMQAIARAIVEAPLLMADSGALQRHYRSLMWRGDGGYYPYVDAATGEHFTARIVSVASTGRITLEEADGTLRRYAFKEVVAVV